MENFLFRTEYRRPYRQNHWLGEPVALGAWQVLARRGVRLALGRGGGLRGGIVAAASAVVHGVVACAFAAAQHLHFIGNDVGRVALHAVLVGVFAGFDAAFYVHRAAFAQVLACNFGQFAKKADAVPFGLFHHLTRAAFVFAAGGNGDVGNGLAAGQIAYFRVTAQVAYQNDFVDGCHVVFLMG